MTDRNTDWYEHLEDQSRTHHIYTLIHGYPLHDWAPNHDCDFVTLRLGNIPPDLEINIPAEHFSDELKQDDWCFPEADYVLLNSNFLTDYLEAAKRLTLVEDLAGREFIELLFDCVDEYKDIQDDDRSETDYTNTSPKTLQNKEDAIGIAYELLRTANEKGLAYEYAKVAENFLDSKQVLIGSNPDMSLWEIAQIMLGYNVVGMVYAWNNKWDEAACVDQHYIFHPNVWQALRNHIAAYLEMLMFKKQPEYLKYLFRDREFRDFFKAHYEAYISLMVDDTHELTRMQDVVAIINRVNNAPRGYL